MIKLSPSILAADFANLGRDIQLIDQAGAEYVHIDVMDGHFVPSTSLGVTVVEAIRPCTDRIFDVHLMMSNPDEHIESFVKAGADIIGVHAEACVHLHRTLQMIKDYGKKACVVLNPATPVNVIEHVLDQLDMVLLMTVNPGFGGQKYIPGMTDKIRSLRQWLNHKGADIDIEVDGGIKLDNVTEVLEAGANVIVAGSAIFGEHTAQNTRKFLQLFESMGKHGLDQKDTKTS